MVTVFLSEKQHLNQNICHAIMSDRTSAFLPQICFIFSYLNTQTLTSSEGDVFPNWAYQLGWAISLSSVVPVPIYAVVRLCLAQGTFRQVRAKTLPAY